MAHTSGEAKLSPTLRMTRWPTDGSPIPEPQGDTFATPGPDARRIDNQQRQRRSLGFSRPGVPPSLAIHIASQGPSSRCARGRAGGTHPSIGKGGWTLTSCRPQAADSSEPPASRTNKISIGMSRRRLRHISRRTCPRNAAPPLPVEASSFERPLRACGFDEPLLDRSRAHPADGPQSQQAHNVFGVFLRHPIGVFEALQLQFNHKPCS